MGRNRFSLAEDRRNIRQGICQAVDFCDLIWLHETLRQFDGAAMSDAKNLYAVNCGPMADAITPKPASTILRGKGKQARRPAHRV
jgi:hypothetical protein